MLNYTSLPYCTFELVINALSTSADTSLQVAKCTTKQKSFDLCRPATGLGGVAENTKKLQMRFVNVAELLQVSCKALSFVFVSLLSVWCGPGLT
jgi:hypothetical protein